MIPSSNVNFNVTKVSVSVGGTYVALSGPQGVSVMEMPLRWGADGVYQDGKPKISCQSYNLHEHSANQLETYQTRWHPNSPTDSHLLILLSDNSIRMYDESTLKHSWRVGPIPNYAAVEKNLSYLQCLGDTAVDFDIAPARIRDDLDFNETSDLEIINNSINSLSLTSSKNQREQQKKIEWPVVVLRGNGTIFVLNAGLNTKQPRLQGPLTVIPALRENYGDDSCSLLVIPTLPPTIVIAETTGIVHHALLIEASNEDYTLNETKLLRNEWDLYVLESVRLELGLSDDKMSEATSSQIYLKRDPINEQRYFCYHQTGLHGIIIGFVQQLQSYIEGEMEPNMNIKSRAEYILSTKAFSNSKVNAVAGIGLLQSPSGIFAILSSGQVISMNTIKLSLSSIPEMTVTSTIVNSGDNKVSDKKISFDQHIKELLSSSVTQPILKLDKTKPPTSKQSFELLMNTIQVIRENQFQRHDQVRQEIAKRAKILEFMKNQQKDEIEQLNEEKDAIQDKAYKLADTHEDIMEKQQALQKRVQDILRLVLLRLPSGNVHEKDFTVQIKNIKAKTDKLVQDVRQIKAKHEIQKKQLELIDLNNDSVKVLPQKQEDTIKGALVNMTNQISNLTATVKNISSVIEI